MKQEQDKEIDLLLKRHTRNEKARLQSAFFGEEGNLGAAFGVDQSPHLDADEMNAYAENALPAITRARYATHLIDCNDCRTLVTQLVLSANPTFVETKTEPVDIATAVKQTWGEWFSSLFKFPTLRIAGPVVAVLCVAVIGMVALQSQLVLNKKENAQSAAPTSMPPSTEVAQRGSSEEPGSAPLADSTSQNNANSSNKIEEVISEKKGADSREKNAPNADPKEQAGQPPVEITTLSRGTVATKDAPVDNMPKPAPAQPQTKLEAANKQRSEDVADKKAAEETRVTQADNRPDSDATRDREIAERNVQRPAPNATGGTARVSGPAKEKSVEYDKRANEIQSEAKNDDMALKAPARKVAKRAGPMLRTVSGKQFRREGAGWVDVDYNSSTATTNISRGSDKYKSLISNEPGLRNIAEQLGGEVVVVWKGRAYRFR